MDGRPVGHRARWLLAATLLAVLASSTAFAAAPPASQAGDQPVAATSTAIRDAATQAPILGATTPGGGAAGPPGPRIAFNPSPATTASAITASATTASATGATAPAAPSHARAAVSPPKPTGPWWSVYHGTNHVWMPTLGMSQRVYLFPCSRGTDPANLVYRWGCAGTNNVYLLGHAYGVFKALHDAYSNGKLKKGMPVVYADASGHVRLYRVTTWRIVSPADAGWAIASQSVPSMTLQTCIGPNGSERLNVRLVQASS